MEENMSLKEFKQMIGWDYSNNPLSESSLNLIDGNSVAENKGTKIFGVHFSMYYKYNLVADKIYFPIVFAKGGGRFTAHNREELKEWLDHHCILCYLCDNFEEKVENLPDADYMDIRKEEIKYPNRLVYDEIYSFTKDKFIGYKYIEI